MSKEIVEMSVEGSLGANHELFNMDNSSWETLIVDLGNMTYMNSIAVKEWMLWANRLNPIQKVILKRCPSSLVNQFNQVSGFLSNTFYIESFNVPTICESCNIETNILLEVEKGFVHPTVEEAGAYNPPELSPCEKCGQETELDVLENRYFNFLKRKMPVKP